MIIPLVYHRDLGVSHAEQALRKPHRISIEVKGFQFVSHIWTERSLMLMNWVPGFKPLLEQMCLPHHSVVIYLVASTYHDVEWV